MSEKGDYTFDPSRLPFFKAEAFSDSGTFDFFRFAVEVSADEVFLMRDDSEIVYVNQSACQRLGYTQEELVGMKVWQWDPLFPQSAWPGFWTEFEQSKHLHFETEHKTKDGVVFPVEIHAHYFVNGDEAFLLAFVADLTERKRLEEEKVANLEYAAAQAEAANRAKSRFLANMSHELRTPMHAILSFANLGIKKAPDADTRKYFDRISLSGARLTHLLNNLLDLSKLESGKFKPDFSRNEITSTVRGVLAELHGLARDKGIEIVFLDDECSEGYFDSKLITQVLVNLLSNAFKFGPEGSRVWIGAQVVYGAGPWLRVSVTDEGPGIPVDELRDVFDAFVQSSKTSSEAGGTGLGLPICKEIIELHHGRIWVESPPRLKNKGAEFVFEIPLDENSDEYVKIRWDSGFSVGIPVLDSHHRNIFALINKLIEGAGSDADELDLVCRELGSYIPYHLEYEEELFRESGYPGFAEHAAKHAAFVQQLRALTSRDHGDVAEQRAELIEFLVGWWYEHILHEDKKYTAHLQAYLDID